MSDEARDERLAAFVDAYLKHLEAGAPEPDLNTLPEHERGEARVKLLLLAALWGADVPAAPPLDEDPVAIRFGFNRSNPRVRIDGPRLNLLRRSAGLRSSELAEQLAAMGHDISRAQFARMENAASTTVGVELAAALAVVLDASIADFEALAPATGSKLAADAFADHPLFATTIAEWSEFRGADPAAVAERSRARLTQLHHRGAQEFTAEEWRQILLDVLEADER